MSRVRVKICGLTRAADVAAAAAAGADALGFVFATSPRRLDPETAAGLTADVPGGIIRVGLFMDPEAEEVKRVTRVVTLDLLQFHGSESNDFCARFGLPYIKAISMHEHDPARAAARYPDAAGIVLDSHVPGGAGGTGETFDWRRRIRVAQPVWLAGGLNPGNVGEAVRRFEPWAVDVSSGVERSPGIKDSALVSAFIDNARRAAAGGSTTR